jgi:phage baseplate assembly protein W
VSHSIQLLNGDIAVTGSTFNYVTGLDKLMQDMQLWILEPYGTDLMHSTFGSMLDSYIGTIISSTAQQMIQSEVLRVLSNYQQLQLKRYTANPTKFSPDELLNTINSVSVQIQYSSVYVVVLFTTAAGTQATVQVATSTSSS